jgi:hypothetical protein
MSKTQSCRDRIALAAVERVMMADGYMSQIARVIAKIKAGQEITYSELVQIGTHAATLSPNREDGYKKMGITREDALRAAGK